MFLSFIVPIYNVAPYLEQCIDSLICQDSDDYEIILIDDGSTDNSGEICDRYAEKTDKVKVIHKSNGGPSSARNTGIKEANGVYLAMIDGDDYIEKNCFASIKQTVISQDNPQIVFMKAYKVFPNGNQELLDEKYDAARIVGQNRREVLNYLSTLKKYPGSACTKIIKKDFVQRNNLTFDPGSLCEDLKFVMNMLLIAESFGYYKGDYYYYRQNRNGSRSNSVSFKSFNDRMGIYNGWIEKEKTAIDDSEKNILKSALAYEYKIMLADVNKLEDEKKKIAYHWLNDNRYLLSFRNDRDIKLIRICEKHFGVKLTSRLIFEYLKGRK